MKSEGKNDGIIHSVYEFLHGPFYWGVLTGIGMVIVARVIKIFVLDA